LKKSLYMLGELTDQDMEWLVENGYRERLLSGADLIRQGEKADALYIVLEGELSILMDDILRVGVRLGVGEILGEISFVDDQLATATVRAVTPCIVLSVPRSRIDEKLAADTAFAARFYRALALFLAHRLRRSTLLGYAEDSEDTEPLGDSVLEGVTIAGDRLRYLFDRLAVHS